MRKSLKLILFLLIVLSVIITVSPSVEACGGFFCTNTPVDQNAERIIFTINGDNTITAVVGINYVGEAEDFSWVVPVPSPPELDVAETESLDRLQNATNVWFVNPPNYCEGLLYITGGLGGGGGGEVIEGNVGPYDYAIIRNEDADELITWLRDNGYQVTEDMEPIIAEYVTDGMYFLAMRLSQDSEVGDIQPIIMTYESEKPMIPLKLTAVAAVDDMPVIVWIFADQQYVPENFAHPQPDYGNMSAPSQIINWQGYSVPTGYNSTYRTEQRRIQAEFDGLAFITEYAQPSTTLLKDPEIPSEVNFFFSQAPQSVTGDAFLEDLIIRYPYITRLRAQLSPDQMTLDPTFIPDPDAEDVSNRVDLVEHVDPLHYWGCSTRTISVENEALNAHTRIGEVVVVNETGDRTLDAQFDIAHPNDWVFSQLTINSTPVFVMSPEPVDESGIEAYFAGEQTPPMFIAAIESTIPGNEGQYWSSRDIFLHLLNQEAFPDREGGVWQTLGRRPVPYGPDENLSGTLNFMIYGIFTTEDDWSENADMYRAMLRHARNFQYYSHPDLKHTLFVGNERMGIYNQTVFSGSIGYPTDWIEHWSDEGYAYVIPVGAEGDDDAPVVKMLPWHLFTEFGYPPQDTDSLISLLETYYNLNADQIDEIRAIIESTGMNLRDFDFIPIMEFEHNGRRGFIRISGNYVAEASIADGDNSVDDETFFAILESLKGWINRY